MSQRKVSMQEASSGGNNNDDDESTPLKTFTIPIHTGYSSSDDDDDEDGVGNEYFDRFKKDSIRRESKAADQLSMRLLAVDDDDSETEERVLRESLAVAMATKPPRSSRISGVGSIASTGSLTGLSGLQYHDIRGDMEEATKQAAYERICTMVSLIFLAFGLVAVALWVGVEFIGPPNQPVGPYELVERQEGDEFFNYYTFYEGPDSVGSNGYNTYVSEERAHEIKIANVTHEEDELDIFYGSSGTSGTTSARKTEPFLYLMSAPTEKGPRESIRLEGKRRFNRGLFIIDVRHMPAGCGVWPAFWLTDEANWPVNGEIDIVEGVNYQSEAKTALHATKGCDMYDVPLGTMTGSWDTAVGIPDRKTGIPDMTMREAKNCFVYDPHQWLNQGCVAIDTDGDSLGIPLNEKGGGVFALEWDPVNRHVRTWVFSPHTTVPENLVQAIRTAQEPLEENRIQPDPAEWPIPYGYFPVGDNTNCPSSHFRNMRLVLNTAFCGSVSGNRYWIDCKNQSKTYNSCNAYVKSQPEELQEAYWKIRGVYVYQRSWEKAWLS